MTSYKVFDANFQDIQARQFKVGEITTDELNNANRITFYDDALQCMHDNASGGGEVSPSYRFTEVRAVGDVGVALFSKTTRTTSALQVICELTREEFLSRCTGKLGSDSWEANYNKGLRHGFSRNWSQSKVLVSEDEHRDGLPLHSTSWFESGQIKTKCTYREGKRHGISQEWRKDGKLKTEELYVDGKLDGSWRQWSAVATLQIEAHYTMGELDGPWQRWTNSDQLELSMTYRAGKLDGPWQRRYPSGRLELEIVYVDGRISVTSRHHDKA